MTAEDQFKKFLTSGQGDSIPVEKQPDVEMTDKQEEIVKDKGYKVTQLTVGFKISIPGTYSSAEFSQTAEVLDDSKLADIKNQLISDTANTTHITIHSFLKQLIEGAK